MTVRGQNALDRVFRSKVETLLGERGKKDDQAVRFRDLSGAVLSALRSSTATIEVPGNIQDIVNDAVADAIGDYTPPSLEDIQASIDAARQDATAAAAAAQNALAQAGAASGYTDQAVADAKEQLSVEYDAAQQAVADALAAAESAGQSATAAADSGTTAETARGAAETFRNQAAQSATAAGSAAAEASESAGLAIGARDQSGASATASASSASEAGGFADAASASATAANQSRIDAEAARSGADGAASAASVARNESVLARENAEAAAAAAQSSMEMSAQIMSRSDNGVITDQYLASESWARWAGQGSLTLTSNEEYPIGRTWAFTVTDSQLDGIRLTDSVASGVWPGQTNAGGYVVEVEYTFTGSLVGAYVLLNWANSAGSVYGVQKTLAEMTAGESSEGHTRTARAVFVKPPGFAGTFASHNAYVLANFQAPLAAKTIKLHRINIRVATEEELGSGEVMAQVQAHLSQNYMTSVTTNEAIADAQQTVQASINGVSATVTRQQTALAGLNGSVARFRDITTVDGGRVAAGIEAVAWNNQGGATGSLLQLHGDNVIAKGTMSTNALVVGIGRNMLVDPSFEDGLAHWASASQNDAALSVVPAGSAWAHPGWPTLRVYQPNATSTGYSIVSCRPVTSANGAQAIGVAVGQNVPITASVYVSAHRCDVQLSIYFYSDDGTLLESATSGVLSPGSGGANSPDDWPRISATGTSPTNTRYVTLVLRKYGTKSGSNSFLFIWKPQLEEVAFEGQQPGQWSPGGTTYINGGRLFTESLAADSASILTLQAWNGRFTNLAAANIRVGNGEIDNVKIGNIIQSDNFVTGEGGAGWRINKQGNSEFNTVKIRRQLEIASGTVNVGYFVPQTQLSGVGTSAGIAHTGAGVNLSNGPGAVRTVLTTTVPISAWLGAQKTYLANAGMTGSVNSSNTDTCYWGWAADVLPLTKWSGNQSLRIRLSFWSQSVNSVSDCIISWKLYEVS